MVDKAKPEYLQKGVIRSSFKSHGKRNILALIVVIVLLIIAGGLVLSHKPTMKKKVVSSTKDGIPKSQITTDSHLGTPAYVYKKSQVK